MSDRKLTVSFGGAPDEPTVTSAELVTWEEFAARLTRQPPETTDKASVGWYSVAEFDPPYRHGKNLVARHALTLDYDAITRDDVKAITKALEPFAYAMYTTHSHTADKPRLRVVMPLSRPAGDDEFCAVSRRIAGYAGIELASRESHAPAQMMFLPAVKPGADFKGRVHAGAWVDVDAELGSYENWTDRKSWPHRKDHDNTHRGETIVQPDEKPGIVGDFCRAFDIPKAIERFQLPYVPTSNPDRWTYTAGSRPEGAIIYDDGRKLHSHHDTDPAHGQTNAFDLVRLHRFGDKDHGSGEGISITQRPSFRAMVSLALDQPEVRAKQIIDELDDLGPLEQVEVSPSGTQSTGDVVGSAANRFRVIPAVEFTGSKPLDWIIKSLLPKAQLGVLYGPSGSGKSFLAHDVAASIEQGIQWRGLKTKRGRTVYVIAEGAGGFKGRQLAYSKEHGVPIENLPAVIPEAPNLAEAKDVAALTKAIQDYGKVDLVVIDTLSASFVGNENSGEDVGRVLRHCKFIHEHTGAMVLLVHHSGKDETKGARGWSGLRAAADFEMEVSRSGDYRQASLTKLKDGEDGKKWGFQLRIVILGMDADGDEISSCVLEAAEVLAPGQGNRPEPRGEWPKIVLKAARQMAANGPVKLEALIQFTLSKLTEPPGEGKVDRRIERIRRAVDTLLDAGVWLFKSAGDRVSLTRAVEAGEEFDDEA